ncbi:DENN domain-containing protein 2A isoform X1 [Periophthalmus magnuspinnatus]|uniref:DENN domain-containing protein 2A isoform X1 n=1 Tax=Periophthalmus magnuspinnatus TaxID=409849 RepID=UPI00243721F7|nr:DENN domain-containing protein 2A isoform X1 [Periophthalmus magnuspinnatus]XP_055078212.1 DENN domain-containing protein 2A isoform X1 [Periophthalmus magnuspinnatus]
MPAASTMTGGRALLLCTNTENCIYQSVNGFQCCGFQLRDAPLSVVAQPSEVCGTTGNRARSDPSGPPQRPLSPSVKQGQSLPDNMLTQRRTTTSTDPRTPNIENGLCGTKLNNNKSPVKSASIRDKISQWEGKREPTIAGSTDPEAVRKKDPKISEVQRSDSKRFVSWERQDSGKENFGKVDLKSKSTEGNNNMILDRPTKPTEQPQDKKNVLIHVKKLEKATKDSPDRPSLAFPGNYYCPPSKEEQEESEKRTTEPIFGTFDVVRSGSRRRRDAENVYSEPGAPSINPLPKPQRTFQHHTPPTSPVTGPGVGKGKRTLPPLPSIPPPPLPSSPPPGVCRRVWSEKPRDANNRKSYEFEDLLQSSTEGCRTDWYAQSRLGLTRTLSEENVYEDIIDPPSKENPYEDIEVERSCLGTKCYSPMSSSPIPDTPTKQTSKPGFFRQTSERRSFKLLELRKINRDTGICGSPSRISPPSTPSSPDDTPCLSGDPYNRRRRKIPKMVLKINAIFEARRGKKRMKRVSQSTESSSGRVTDENSESESDTEEKLKAHSQRLVSVQSMLRQTGKYRTLERDLMELQERKLFEYFIVVALHKTKAGVPYLPEVTQQFPLKLERSFKFMRETEDQLKVIPQFCFPDAKDWAPVDNFPSETFSFVLTGEDGSRRFGYCRRLLPSGKGRRLPEVYCIVSRLGCFDLFSKILDEVEKRRAISPALVQPFMRGIMEAPFPAPGRTITVKNFLPGSGTEVIELCRPSDSRLEHVDFECLFSSLSLRLLLKVFASLLLERRVIFTADKLSTLSQCCHAVVALLYPFTWQHTYIPVLPPSMLDIVCTPTPFIVGLLSSSLPRLKDLPIEEVLVVDLGNSRFLRQLDDEDSILPHKLQAALEHVLDKRKELACDKGDLSNDSSSLSTVVSEAFVRFFVEIVGHYSLFMGGMEREDESVSSPSSPSPSSSTFQREPFRKAVTSKSLRRFLEVFMETQMFTGFIQERELRRQGLKGLFEVRAQEYLDSLPGSEQRGVNKFLKGLGNKMKFLSKK